MALVKTLEMVAKDRQTLHGETACLVSVFTDGDGARYIQLDTVGSKARKIPGKVSQALQFNSKSAQQLKQLIVEVYPDLK